MKAAVTPGILEQASGRQITLGLIILAVPVAVNTVESKLVLRDRPYLNFPFVTN
jgi:hypothetical protein